jgi:hypothetical protein
MANSNIVPLNQKNQSSNLSLLSAFMLENNGILRKSNPAIWACNEHIIHLWDLFDFEPGGSEHSCGGCYYTPLGFLPRADHFKNPHHSVPDSRRQLQTKVQESKLEDMRKSWEAQLLKIHCISLISFLLSFQPWSAWSPLFTINCKTFVHIIKEVRKKGRE